MCIIQTCYKVLKWMSAMRDEIPQDVRSASLSSYNTESTFDWSDVVDAGT